MFKSRKFSNNFYKFKLNILKFYSLSIINAESRYKKKLEQRKKKVYGLIQ